MYEHIGLRVSDLHASLRFYGAALRIDSMNRVSRQGAETTARRAGAPIMVETITPRSSSVLTATTARPRSLPTAPVDRASSKPPTCYQAIWALGSPQ